MPTRIRLRRATAAQWAAENPILGLGEPGVEMTVGNQLRKLKIGDGVTAWEDLDYFAASGGGGGSDLLAEAGVTAAEVTADGELLLTWPAGTFRFTGVLVE